MRLIVVRHGETLYNAQKRFTGQSDIPLNALGRLQAVALGESLATQHLDAIVSSDMVRTRVTAQTITPPGGETVAHLRDRCAHALSHWHGQYQEANVLWVTHGGLIGVLLCHVLGINLKRRWQFRHDNASISELHLSGERITIVRLNETAHIRSLKGEKE